MYMEAPHGFGREGKVCMCLMSLEGSKQAGNLYYKEHAIVLTDKCGAKRCEHDPNLYRIDYPLSIRR